MMLCKNRKELVKKYKLTSSDLMEADLIILSGLIIKDRETPINLGGNFSINKYNYKNIIIGCETTDGKIRIYRSF